MRKAEDKLKERERERERASSEFIKETSSQPMDSGGKGLRGSCSSFSFSLVYIYKEQLFILRVTIWIQIYWFKRKLLGIHFTWTGTRSKEQM